MCSLDSKKSSSGGILPILALLTAQLFTSSWHVLGKHVMQQVPFLSPIAFVLLRTFISSLTMLVVGRIHEGYCPFPPLFRDGPTTKSELSLQVGLLQPASSAVSSGNSVGLSISRSTSANSLTGICDNRISTDDVPLPLSQKLHQHHKPRRRKRLQPTTFWSYAVIVLRSTMSSLSMVLRSIRCTPKYYQQQISRMNSDTVLLISSGLAGMLLLPTCYATGLLLTSPTVVSVYDGPFIPLGCFCAAVTLGLEKRSKNYPIGQVGSLILTVGGSIVVLLVDYLGGGHGMRGDESGGEIRNGVNEHIQFMRGNLVLLGVVASYSAAALLQKKLNHFPAVHLTGWMFGIGFLGCLFLLLLDSMLGSSITGCSLGQALFQLYLALSTSPTFRIGIFYSAYFVGCANWVANSYASNHLESSVITLFAAIQPPITAVLEWIWEGKGLGWKKLGGMACTGLGMWMFTYIKRVEKESIELGGNHHQKKQRSRKKAQSYENGHDCSNGEGSPKNNHGSSHLTNRKLHADV